MLAMNFFPTKQIHPFGYFLLRKSVIIFEILSSSIIGTYKVFDIA